MPEKIDRTGEKRIANCGMEMEIVAYRNRKDIDVQFSNGTVAEHKAYTDFCKCTISPPGASHVGEKNVAKRGLEMEIIAYRNAKDIDIRFSDGAIAEHRSYFSFANGRVMYPTDRTGKKGIANCGLPMEIIAYREAGDIDVRFLDGEVAEYCKYNNFLKGKVMHPAIKKGNSLFHGVRIKKAFRDGENVYYDCLFPDGERDICTLPEVMERTGTPAIF